MKRPKLVVLYDFIKKLQDCGIDLSGCNLQGRADNEYTLVGLVNKNVQVRYGPRRELIGHMTRGILVTGLSIQTKSGKKISGIYGKSDSIVVHFTEDARRW